MSWYKTAADAGDPLAYFNVGALYQSGRGVERDESAAIEWFQSGAELGDPYSMIALADANRDGVGVSKNPVEALAWYRTALIRIDPQDVGAVQTSERQASRIRMNLTQDELKTADARFEYFQKLTAPPEPEKKLDDGESRI
jgi:TPR repeat protein